MKTKEKNIIETSAPTPHTPISVNIASSFKKLFKELPARDVQVLEMRFGLNKHDKHTLESIGGEFGVTRERVRQIENSAIDRIFKLASSDLKSINKLAHGILTAHGGILLKNHLLRNLLAEIDSNSEADMNYLELALMTSRDITTVHNTIQFHPYYHLSEIGTGTLPGVTRIIINKLKKKNDSIGTEELQKSILSEANISLTEETILNIAKISKDLKTAEDGKIGLFKWAHINPRNIHDKIVFVMKQYGKPIHFNDLTNAIRAKTFDSKIINVQAVHNELIRDKNFILIGRGIYALSEWGYKPGTVADVITDILKEHGPLDKEDILDKVLEVRQVKKITILLNLKNKDLFARVGRSTYDLK